MQVDAQIVCGPALMTSTPQSPSEKLMGLCDGIILTLEML
jgi:hypothetical protein